jgi:hypothetical protein
MAPVTRKTPFEQAQADVKSQRRAVQRARLALAEAERLSTRDGVVVENAWLQSHRNHLADEQDALDEFIRAAARMTRDQLFTNR